jgi:arabinose-5-phosphate isomerase
MLKELLEKGRESLNDFFDKFDQQQMEMLINMILEKTTGMVFFTGVGKSGLIAKKIAQTMTSTGTKSLYISPLDALHGDIGIVNSQDIFFLLSKSGESDELLNLLPILRSKNVKTVAVVSNMSSRLAKSCDTKFHLPCKHELCPFDMAPTVSTTIQMIFGDILAIGLMKKRNFSQDQFAENHPAGRIGKRIHLKVKDLMVQGASLPLCKPDDKIADVLVELSNKRSGCILVVNDEHCLEGIFTDGDLRRSLQNHGPEVLQKPMNELMTVSPKFIAHDVLAIQAMLIMENDQKKAITVLPVLENSTKVVGLIRLHDILQSGI